MSKTSMCSRRGGVQTSSSSQAPPPCRHAFVTSSDTDNRASAIRSKSSGCSGSESNSQAVMAARVKVRLAPHSIRHRPAPVAARAQAPGTSDRLWLCGLRAWLCSLLAELLDVPAALTADRCGLRPWDHLSLLRSCPLNEPQRGDPGSDRDTRLEDGPRARSEGATGQTPVPGGVGGVAFGRHGPCSRARPVHRRGRGDRRQSAGGRRVPSGPRSRLRSCMVRP